MSDCIKECRSIIDADCPRCDNYAELERQLSEAEKVIDFYGDTDNYQDMYYGNYGLITECGDETIGKRAREYQRKYSGKIGQGKTT